MNPAWLLVPASSTYMVEIGQHSDLVLDLSAEPLFGDKGVLDDLTGDLPSGGAVPGQADATECTAIT